MAIILKRISNKKINEMMESAHIKVFTVYSSVMEASNIKARRIEYTKIKLSVKFSK